MAQELLDALKRLEKAASVISNRDRNPTYIRKGADWSRLESRIDEARAVLKKHYENESVSQKAEDEGDDLRSV